MLKISAEGRRYVLQVEGASIFGEQNEIEAGVALEICCEDVCFCGIAEEADFIE